MNLKPKIVFIGTPEFGAIILEKLCKTDLKPVLVVTAPDKPAGRKQIITPPPVKISAQKYNIPFLQPEILASSKLQITNSKPDLIITAAYGQKIPKEILEIPKFGCLNVHPSLLPKYRGPSPIQYAILNGDKETGITVILMDEKIDHGPIVTNSKFQITNSRITHEELLKDLADLGSKLLVETIPKWIKKEIKPKPQDESKATYTKIIKKEDGEINWKKSAEEIEREIRAFDSWPGSWTNWQILKNMILKIKILKSRIYTQQRQTKIKTFPLAKTLVVPQNEIGVQCGKNILVVESLQLEGKKPTTPEEFLRGHPDFIGTILK